jgi:CRP/FNR family transcriptional regulator, cyclic AMP receptor protein
LTAPLLSDTLKGQQQTRVQFVSRVNKNTMRKVLFIFSQMTDGDVDWLADAGERVHVKAGTVLIEHNSRVEHVYFLLDGQLVIRAGSGADIATLDSGEIVGEMSLVDPAPTTVSVQASMDATLLRIADGVIRDKLRLDPMFAARFYFALCIFLADRMRNTTMRLGYGEANADPHAKDELNETLLDTFHVAGARFDRMLKRLAG